MVKPGSTALATTGSVSERKPGSPGDYVLAVTAPLRSNRSDALGPIGNFGVACTQVIEFLATALPMEIWVVARAIGDDWVVLSAADTRGEIGPGSAFRWSETICSRMIAGRGPRFAANTASVASYAMAPMARELPVGAYLGAELVDRTGFVFGTLCGLNPYPVDESLFAGSEDLVCLQAQLLSALLAGEQQTLGEDRDNERTARAFSVDAITGALSATGWQLLIRDEEQRCAVLGLPAAVVVVELGDLREATRGPGLSPRDRALRDTADIIREATRRSDALARIADNDFAVLLTDVGPLQMDLVASRIREGLARRNIRAFVGSAMRDPRRNLTAAVARAATARYQDKRR